MRKRVGVLLLFFIFFRFVFLNIFIKSLDFYFFFIIYVLSLRIFQVLFSIQRLVIFIFFGFFRKLNLFLCFFWNLFFFVSCSLLVCFCNFSGVRFYLVGIWLLVVRFQVVSFYLEFRGYLIYSEYRNVFRERNFVVFFIQVLIIFIDIKFFFRVCFKFVIYF